jgi:hypothetical protein
MITNAKISCSPFDIDKSKIVVVEWHVAKAIKTYNCLISPINPSSNSWENYFLKEKQVLDANAYQIVSTKYFPQNVKEDGFW